jgi:hypothetical protein
MEATKSVPVFSEGDLARLFALPKKKKRCRRIDKNAKARRKISKASSKANR